MFPRRRSLRRLNHDMLGDSEPKEIMRKRKHRKMVVSSSRINN